MIIPALVFLGLVACFFVFIKKEPISLLATKDFEVIPFSDQGKGGDSRMISCIENDNGILFNYQIGTAGFNYAGINIVLGDSLQSLIDNFNQFKVIIQTSNLSAISVCSKTWEEGISKADDYRSLRVNYHFTSHLEENKTYNILANYSDFETRNWWIGEFVVDQKIPDSPNWSNTKQITVVGETEVDSSLPSSIHLKGFYLSNEYSSFYLFGILLEVFCLAILIIPKLELNKKSKVTIEYKSLEIDEESDNRKWEDELIHYIGKEYANPELKLNELVKRFKVPERNISQLISDKFQMNFRQYINSIRIKEAKKLLLETELSVKEIAYTVGYNSPNNFRKVFKNSEGVSPTSLRE